MSNSKFGFKTRLGQISNIIEAQSAEFPPTFDPDAEAFLIAADITDNTQKNAINNLVINLKAAEIWSKMKAIYPFVGGTAESHKWNLKDPRDLDAAFRLVFFGGWTHDINGAQPNGTNGYASTKLNPILSLTTNSTHLSLYSRTSTIGNLVRDFAAFVSGANPCMSLGTNTGVWISDQYNFNDRISGSISSATGFYVTSRTSSTSHKLYKNGSILGTNTTTNSTTLPSINLFLGAANISASGETSITGYSTKQYAFASIGDGLTDTEALVFNQIVEGYQYELGRNINTVNPNYYNTSYNNETNAFLYASEITDDTQKTAINNLVDNLKTAGIWTKMKAIYPMIGGTAESHKWNLKDPQDTNAAFRLSFIGGWTHTSNGATPNGTNGYADTNLNMSTQFAVNDSTHISFYSRISAPGFQDYEMGVYNTSTGAISALVLRRSDFSNSTFYGINTTSSLTYTDTDAAAFYISNRLGTTMNGFRNLTKTVTTTSTAITRPSLNMFIGNLNTNGSPNSGLWGTRECAFASIGDGLTDTEAADFYTAVQTYQTTLGRQV